MVMLPSGVRKAVVSQIQLMSPEQASEFVGQFLPAMTVDQLAAVSVVIEREVTHRTAVGGTPAPGRGT